MITSVVLLCKAEVPSSDQGGSDMEDKFIFFPENNSAY